MKNYIIDAKAIGKRIKSLRLRQNKTQIYYADMTYISPSYLSLIEDGKRLPTIEVLAQISKVADVSIDYLVFGNDASMNPEEKTFNRLCSIYSEDEIRRALKLMEYYLKLDRLKDPSDEIK